MLDSKIVAVGHSKGGVGKSTLTILFARGMSEIHGKKVCILDCDYQGSLVKILQRELENSGKSKDEIGIDVISVIPKNIFKILETVFGKYDIIFLDMPRITNETDQEILEFYYNTNMIIMPMMTGNTDIDAFMTFVNILKEIKSGRHQQGVPFEFYGLANINDGSADYNYIQQDAIGFGVPMFQSQVKKLHSLKKISFISNLFNNKIGKANLLPIINEFKELLES